MTGELRRQDSPVFYHKDKIAIAVKQAGGCTKLTTQASSLVEIVDQLDSYDTFEGFLLFCDTDTENIETIQKRVTEVFCQEGFEYADKVQFGAISTVLKPDKPVRFSIKDKIIRTKYKKLYMKIPEFEVLYTFLEENLK